VLGSSYYLPAPSSNCFARLFDQYPLSRLQPLYPEALIEFIRDLKNARIKP